MAKVGDAGRSNEELLQKDSFNQEEEPREPQEHLYKVLVIGDFGVGKTSIIRRYTEDVFSPNYKLTIGVDFSLKTLEWSSDLKINLQLWDIAGHERFGHMTRVYYKYAIGAIIVFDLTRVVTFDSVSKWLGDVNQKVVLENGDPVPVLLLANKCDVENPQVDKDRIEELCSKHNNIIGWHQTSAKDGTNISEAMDSLVTRILDLSNREPDLPVDVVDLGSTDTQLLNTPNGYSDSTVVKGGKQNYLRDLSDPSAADPQVQREPTMKCCS